MLRKITIILLLVCNSLFVFAQSNGIIVGYAYTDEGSPLIYANVQIKETQQGVVTNNLGRFEFADMPTGDYTLLITAIGYEANEQKINVKANKICKVDCRCRSNTQELQAIVVTAEKQEDDLQKVPISVTAIDGKKIQALQVSNINEIGRITPNFRTYDDGGGSFPLVSTRGIITIDETPIVGVYVDDVPLFNTGSFPSYFGDLERIEVLKGPQGTLYGRNSLGGVINIVSKKPTNQTKGFITAGYGNLNQYEFSAGINTPLVKDKLFFRINGGITQRDGYVENTFLNNKDLYGRKAYIGNIRLNYLPSKKWTLSFNSNIEHRKVNAYAFLGGFGATQRNIDSLVTNHPFQVRQNTQGVYTTISWSNALKVGYANDKIKFDAIAAYQFTDKRGTGDDFDFSEFDIQSIVGENKINTLSEELRISSNTDKKFSWLGGAYIYWVDNKTNNNQINGADNAFFAPSPEIAAQYPFTDISNSIIQQNGFSLFGQASYKLTEQLTLTAGLRYELENSSLEVKDRYEKNGEDYIYPDLGAVPNQYERSTQFDALSPKVNLSYQAKENLLLYVNFARGYRPGGVNPFVSDPQKATFEPEYSLNYELGIKNKLWNNRAKVNASVFYITYEGQQLFTILNLATFDFGRSNIGNSLSYGAELETEFLLTKGLNFTANIGYLETEITNYKLTGFTGEIDNKGNKQIMSPRWNGNVSINYDIALTEKWKANLSLDYQYQSDVFFDAENTAKQEAYGLLNSRIVIGNQNFELALWAKNLNNKTYLSYGYSVAASGIFASYGLPRTYGLSVTAKF
jgi:iron complex outermembrane receptor protein